jgi:hypothetical protein
MPERVGRDGPCGQGGNWPSLSLISQSTAYFLRFAFHSSV